MGSFARTAVGIAAATLSGATLTAAPSAANAQSTAGARRVVITVPCDTTQLVSAVTQANTAGTATIHLAQNCTYLTNAPLSFTGASITLRGGPSTAIKADPAQAAFGPILNVVAGAALRVQGIFVLGGSGGSGGGIANAGNLTLNFVTITGNAATNGGGLFNTGRALIVHSVIKASTATANGGGIFNQTGGTLTVFETLVAGNNAGNQGGGTFTNAGASTRIIQSTIEKNTAAQGGGIANFGATSLDRTLVQQNKANPGLANGGGIFNAGAVGSVTLRRSLVRTNAPTNCSPVGTIPGCLG
jgi:hypothetical protein